jgi:predicted transcriptional regulator
MKQKLSKIPQKFGNYISKLHHCSFSEDLDTTYTIQSENYPLNHLIVSYPDAHIHPEIIPEFHHFSQEYIISLEY